MVCSFCGAEQDAQRRIIGGPDGVAICSACVQLASDALGDDSAGIDVGGGWVKRVRTVPCGYPR